MLAFHELGVEYPTEKGRLRAVDNFTTSIDDGVIYALVGESGAGKSTVARATMQILPEAAKVNGEILYKGTNLLSDNVAPYRGKEIAMIFQEPNQALNPVLTVGKQLRRVIKTHYGDKYTKKEMEQRILEVLGTVGIAEPEARLSDYPVQLSGGMNQRVTIAMTLLCEPDFLIADEPTTKLDVTIAADILELIQDIKTERDFSILFITHDIGTVAQYCDRIGVMYAGNLIEEGPVDDVLTQPRHPYTKDLLECVPDPNTKTDNMVGIDGTMPSPVNLDDRCYYADRCSLSREECWSHRPPLETTGENASTRRTACLFPEEV